jgi:hypothetical protein
MADRVKHPNELGERSVRLLFESKRPIAHDRGIHKETLCPAPLYLVQGVCVSCEL